MNEYPSIFTQVLGPIGPGPSSSSTCGMVRVAYLGWQIFGSIPKTARILIPKAGLIPATLQGMRSDLAVVTGLLGRDQRHPRFLNAYADAKEAGMEFSFELVDWDISGTAQLFGMELSDDNGFRMFIKGDSTGGGTCMIREIEGCKVSIRGDQHEVILLFNGILGQEHADKLMRLCEEHIQDLNEVSYVEGEKGVSLIQIKAGLPVSKEYIETLKEIPELRLLRVIHPVHPVVVNYKKHPPFDSAEEMIEYCEQEGVELWQAAIAYEKALSGWTEEEVLNYAKELYRIIDEATENGLKGGFDMNGIMTPKASVLKEQFDKNAFLPLGAMASALPAALGVMEYSNSSGTIVYLPTGGSSGIVPGILRGTKVTFDLGEEEQAKALLVAGLIGVCMAKGNNFSGCEFGCQAEVACATAMASGALMHYVKGNAKQACDAASMCLQSMLGLICDTVAGLVQVPCLTRNITGAAIAYACTDSVMAGFDVVIPLSDMVGALKEVGAKLIKLGMIGACTSPTGCRLAKEQEERNPKLRN